MCVDGGSVVCLLVSAGSLLVATGLSLRSDVYVDTICRIEITTRTRELLLEEEPEKFEVRAFDDEGEILLCMAALSPLTISCA